MEPTRVIAVQQQWEYRDLYGRPFESFVEMLNNKGKQGWDVVNVFSEGTQYRALLKRPLSG